MYNITRQEAADILDVSTRSIDRYIKSWKIRTKKNGKMVFLNENDINNIKWTWTEKQEVIIPKKQEVQASPETQQVETKNLSVLDNIYTDLKNEIIKKDEIIQDLSIKLWAAQEIAKNSVSMIEFNKTQNLLEEWKESLSKEINELKHERYSLIKDLKYEKNTNNILMVVVWILIILCVVVWYVSI